MDVRTRPHPAPSPARRSLARTALRGVALAAAVSLVAASSAMAATPPASEAPAKSPRTLVVAPGGDDGAAGTPEAPMASMRAAVKKLKGTGTVALRSGRYAERIRLGAKVRDLTISAYDGERAILDGSSLEAPEGTSAMIEIESSRGVTVDGLEITGYGSTRAEAVPIGVYVHGGAARITLNDNRVHSMGTYGGDLGSFDFNAHGIAVYGDSVKTPITDLAITGNEVDHLKLGASEAIVVNGNVDGWAVTGNDVHDNDNIGIDAIGYEETLPAKYRYTERNRARNGVIADNTVRNIISRGNPAYYEDGSWCNCADGIYVDGGTKIRIERNRVSTSDIGIEVASENPRGGTDHILVANNEISGSRYTGLATGGYCDGSEGCGGEKTGTARDNLFANNTLYDNNTLDDGSPEIAVQYYVTRTTFVNNVVSSTSTDPVMIGTAEGAEKDEVSQAPYVENNLWFAGRTPATDVGFGILGTTYTGFEAYREATGKDARSAFADPLLLDPARGDLHLQPGSPAIDAGADVPERFQRYVTTDVDGDPRLSGTRLDVGAHETGGAR